MLGGRSRMIKIILIAMWLISTISLQYAQDRSSIKERLVKPINKGEAFIWYLSHSGWAIKTQNCFFIFDYTEMEKKPEYPSLINGFINADEIKDQNIYVFVSHAHSDHYDYEIHNWKKSIKKIDYIFGWQADEESPIIKFGDIRERKIIGNVEIYNIHHKFDNIPESAFLITIDGIIIYHSGDHGHSKAEQNKVFKENIDYLVSLGKKIDLAFIPTFGGEFYTIDKLKPKVVFPMHGGGNEQQHKIFAEKVEAKGFDTHIGIAEKRGDCFYYLKGKLEKIVVNQ